MDELLLAQPRGFCAGVDRAIEIVEKAIETHGAPIYVKHEIVHNQYVCDNLRAQGAVFIEDLNEVPRGATIIFSAHGVSKQVQQQARTLGLNIYDATCPLVTKVHVEVAKLREQGRDIIMVGHAGHPEVEGTMGQSQNGMYLVESLEDAQQLQVRDPNQLAYVTQTTLSVDDTAEITAALEQRFPNIEKPKKGDICYATQNRQDAVKIMAPLVDLIIVVGSRTSSNSNRLRELAEKRGVPAYMVDGANDIQPQWLANVKRVGLTAGASAPEVLVQGIVERLKTLGAKSVRALEGAEENVTFKLPSALVDAHAHVEKLA